MLHHRTRNLILCLVASCSILMAGCGGGDDLGRGTGETTTTRTVAASPLDGLDGEQLLQRATNSATSATSVRIAGAGTTEGEDLAFDLRLVRGVGAEGSFRDSRLTVDLVIVGADVYLRMDGDRHEEWLGPAFTERARSKVDGRYVKSTTADARLDGFREMGDLEGFIRTTLTPESTLSRIDGKVVAGVPTVGIRDENARNRSVLYVSDDAQALPLRLEADGTAESGRWTFTQWNAVGDITAPAADDVIDVRALDD